METSVTVPKDERVGRVRGVRTLLLAAGLSGLSFGILGVANDLVAVLALGAGTEQIGALNAIESAAFVLLSVPVGWWLDRTDRRRALQWTQVLATLALLSIPVAWLCGVLTFWQLAGTSFLVGTAGMVWNLGLGALIPGLTGKARAAAAFSRKQAVETSAGLVAPGLTGLMLMVLAAPLALFFAAVLELCAGLVLRWVPAPGGEATDGPEPDGAGPGSASEPRPRFWAGVGEGLRFVLKTKPLLVSTLNAAVLNAALALYAAVSTVYEVRVLGFTPAMIGAVGVAIAAGGLAGAVAGGWLLERFRPVPLAAAMIAVAGTSTVLVPLASLPALAGGGAFALLLVQSLIWNSTVVIANAGLYGVLAQLTPDHLLGRVQSFRMLVAMGPLPLFGLAGGFLGAALGIIPTLWMYVGLALLAAVLTTFLWRMSVKEGWGRREPAV